MTNSGLMETLGTSARTKDRGLGKKVRQKSSGVVRKPVINC